MQVQLLTVGALALGRLAQRRNKGKERRTQAAEEREARYVTSTNLIADSSLKPEATASGSLHRAVLLLAVMVDITLWYFIYQALVSDEGWRSQPRSLWIAAALSVIISLLYLGQRLPNQGGEGRATGPSVSWEPTPAASGRRPLQNLTGTWVKDGQASDSMEEAVRVMQLKPLMRTAIRLVKGLEINQTADRFDLAVFSIISWFKVRESYPMNGEESQEKRRDMRKGKHRGRLVVQKDGCIRLQLTWDDPLGGSGHEVFRLASPTELHAHSHLSVNGRIVKYVTVYRKK